MNIEYVSLSMKVLFVSRIGLSEADLDKYMNDAIGTGFELAEWFTYYWNLIELIALPFPIFFSFLI